MDYVKEATRTLSNEFHAELVDRAALVLALRGGIASAEQLDKVKKALFYGRPAPGIEARYKDIDHARIDMRNTLKGLHSDPMRAEQVLHAVIGLFTEAGEMLEAVLEAIVERKPLDGVNMIEESGDAKWYLAVLADALPFSWGTDEVVNIEKLRKRFPDKFTEDNANVRDLDAERAVLEAGAAVPTDSDLARERIGQALPEGMEPARKFFGQPQATARRPAADFVPGERDPGDETPDK